MTGAEQLDRTSRSADLSNSTGRADGLGYRDPLGLVSPGGPPIRARMVLAVAAVCGAGLLAGLGLFGGPAAKPAKPVTSVGIVKAADPVGSRPAASHVPLTHKPRTHGHKASARTGTPRGVVRHFPLKGTGSVRRTAQHPATARHTKHAGTVRKARPHSSPAKGPAVSR